MSKKKSSTNLGKSLIRSRFGKHNKTDGDSYLHTSELNDGYEWGRLNLQSVTEQNNLEEFLATAELAGTEFTAEKLNVKFISKEGSGLPEAEELAQIAGLHKQHENLLCIPRRPPWTAETSPAELDQNERQSFLEWRRTLAALQDVEGLVMTPYEKNLDFWRQLWRVIERSDIVTQIVDARNPLLFYCSDLEKYVGEKDKGKMCLVLINKADYLDHYQRDAWASYFTERGIRVAFWSAVLETERQEAEKDAEDADQDDTKPEPTEDSSSDDPESDEETKDVEMPDENADDGYSAGREESPNAGQNDEAIDGDGDGSDKGNTVCEHCDNMVEGTDNVASEKTVECESCGSCGGKGSRQTEAATDNMPGGKVRNTAHIYTGPELVEFLRSIHTGSKVNEGRTTVGMVGYPNVGKSSTINAILKMKKVPVSTTPGRTKHFQTLFVDQSLMLCDCPGLVFPSFVTTKADLVVNGILPIDQMRDCIPPSSLICNRIPRALLEKTYGIMLPKPAEGEDLSRPPTAFELLNAYGSMRGYMTARGQPDAPRSSRYILKDYVNGKLLYCHPPPDKDANVFNKFETSETMSTDGHEVAEPGTRPVNDTTVAGRVDTDFFKKGFSAVHNRTARTGGNDTSKAAGGQKDKSWKKHNNRNKKEKMRRVYSHLDGQ